jgi:hypothetical protein
MLSVAQTCLNFVFLVPSSSWSRRQPTYKLTTSGVSLGGRGGKTPTEFGHDAGLSSRIVKGFYGNSSNRTTDGHGRWATSNCFQRVSHFLQPFLLHGLLDKRFARRKRRRSRSPLIEVNWGVSKDFIRIILEWGRELQSLNFFFLQCSWFRDWL